MSTQLNTTRKHTKLDFVYPMGDFMCLWLVEKSSDEFHGPLNVKRVKVTFFYIKSKTARTEEKNKIKQQQK